MLVGVPKEIKNHEYRVGLTPEAAREYVDAGHRVIVETNAGIGISKTDDDYRAIGAEIVDTAEEVFARAEMVVKVKENVSLFLNLSGASKNFHIVAGAPERALVMELELCTWRYSTIKKA